MLDMLADKNVHFVLRPTLPEVVRTDQEYSIGGITEASFDGLKKLISRLKNTICVPDVETAGLEGAGKLIDKRPILSGIGEECVKVLTHPRFRASPSHSHFRH